MPFTVLICVHDCPNRYGGEKKKFAYEVTDLKIAPIPRHAAPSLLDKYLLSQGASPPERAAPRVNLTRPPLTWGRPQSFTRNLRSPPKRGVDCSLQHRQDRKREAMRLTIAILVLRERLIEASLHFHAPALAKEAKVGAKAITSSNRSVRTVFRKASH